MEVLKLSIELLERLQGSPQIHHGLAIMIWDAFLGESFKKLFHLMEEKLGERALEVEKRSKPPLAGCDWILKRDVYTTEMELVLIMGLYVFLTNSIQDKIHGMCSSIAGDHGKRFFQD